MSSSGNRFTEWVSRFLHHLAVRKPSPHTIAAYRRDLEGIGRRIALAAGHGEELDELTLDDLDKPALRAAFASWAEDHAAASIRRAWSAWNGFFDYLVTEEAVAGNPMGAITPPRQSRGKPKAIPGDDVASLLLRTAATTDSTSRNAWPSRDLALVATFLVTGIRLSEAVGLNLGSLDGPQGARRLVVMGKGNKARTVPIEDTLEDLLLRYLAERRERFPKVRFEDLRQPLFVRTDSGTRFTRQQVEYLVDKLYRRAGIRSRIPEGALVHALRHTFATSALDNGVHVVELQELLGHASLETTRRYLDATAAQLRHAVASHPAQAALRQFTRTAVPG
ncbi:MAG: tyrosine-type recombinase/integrase [Acidimicrobiales bacterium]|nr:tyrosine-type recombinase/integrase [Acidimicrobiales bacterium]